MKLNIFQWIVVVVLSLVITTMGMLAIVNLLEITKWASMDYLLAILILRFIASLAGSWGR